MSISSSPSQLVTTHLQGQLLVETSTKIFSEPLHVSSPIRDGLRIIVVLQGRMQLEAGDAPLLDIRTPTTFAVLSEGENRRQQVFSHDTPFSVVLLQIDRELIETEYQRNPASLLCGMRDRSGGSLVLRSRKADTTISALGAQLLGHRDANHGFYRCAKALELASLVFEGFSPAADGAFSGYLTPSDRDRVRAACDLLVANSVDPPDLTDVARRCGINLSKLNRGFRTIYGMAPYRYIQEYRLDRAYKMLASGHFTVSQVASEAGYTPAHFSTLFRRRFGVAPNTLVPHASSREINRLS
ncbi:AraC family transcriptional regulator [Neorhizobium sp. JUb45]|uniref:helix-turn-helix transcriptional regulator n=1 Tax=Neorhizobium sp. JUb45 TaxID=2485113 RepID=UPI001053A4C6|nr:AraC family transcriptional regulator [Neorhizobium sp. JUb45]TCQ96263.1 AraC family transcriptional regulator [Neorhizobium sp. JUb45]